MTDSLNIAFKESLEKTIGADNARKALAAFEEEPSVSVRLNPFKKGRHDLSVTEGADAVPWNPHAFILRGRPSFTADPAFHAGAYYVQDSSAMAVGYMVRCFMEGKDRPFRALDLCAAPGGKTSDLASSLRERFGNSFLLVANEVSRQRAAVLCENVARWGDPNVVVTSVDPAAFAGYEGFFDLILADVPCSGEGMFRKDADAVKMWSPSNVALCESRQRRIVADVWPALAEGGVLVYSTCTFNDKEDDGNVNWIADTLGAEPLSCGMPFAGILSTERGFVLVPGFVPGEGQYCAALRKTGGTQWRRRGGKTVKFRQEPLLPGMFSEDMAVLRKGELFIAIPEVMLSEAEALEPLHPLMKGVAVGEMKGGKLVPHADLALSVSLSSSAFPVAEVDLACALSFLRRETLNLGADAERGVLLVEYDGYRLGFVKNLGVRCNNLLPQSRRIRMEI